MVGRRSWSFSLLLGIALVLSATLIRVRSGDVIWVRIGYVRCADTGDAMDRFFNWALAQNAVRAGAGDLGVFQVFAVQGHEREAIELLNRQGAKDNFTFGP